jgi:hypothetical protein
LGPSLKIYNKDHFKILHKYTEERQGSGGLLANFGAAIKNKMTETHSSVDWSNFMPNILSSTTRNLMEVVRLYLTHFAFENRGDLSEFKSKTNLFLTVAIVEKIEDRVRVYMSTTGLKDLKLNKPLSADQFKNISDEVNLTFLPENKDKFKIEEIVELWLEIKNVSTVHCKVFEFNTLTYYRKTLKPFDTSIDLDGLESTIVRQFDFNEPANCKKR